jgi:DNA topoisomerase IA
MFRRPKDVRAQLSKDEYVLYELIWKRTVASQMADAKGFTATIKLSGTASDSRVAEFSASGTVITFRGFLSAYEEGKDSESDAADMLALATLTKPGPFSLKSQALGRFWGVREGKTLYLLAHLALSS